jgi:hypothetical protein
VCRDDPLDANGNIAKANRSMPFTDQGLADDGDRIRKVKEPGRRASARELFCNLKRWWNGPERTRPAARTNRLLANHAVFERDRFIKEARG